MKKKKVDKEIARLLKQVIDHFDREDKSVRESQIIKWRRLKIMWEGIESTYNSEVAHDWRIPNDSDEDTEQETYYDKPVNVFRAYLETIIAALSVTVPPVTCYPDDADNTLDIETARAGDRIAERIYRHNNASLLWLRALFIFGTEGLVAFYNYIKKSDKYGTYEEKEYEDEAQDHQITSCPHCGYELEDEEIPLGSPNPIPATNIPTGIPDPNMGATGIPNAGVGVPPIPPTPINQNQELNELDMMDEFDPEFIPLNIGSDLCPTCNEMMDPQVERKTFIVNKLVGTTSLPKSRVCLDAFGGLNVKIPVYAKKQENCPYIGYEYEDNWVNFVEEHPEWKKEQRHSNRNRTFDIGVYEPYEAWGRLNTAYSGEYPRNNMTVRMWWLRPATFNILSEDEEKKIRNKFPHGVKVTLGNDEVVEYEDESLDDHWTLNYNPLADHLHHEPLGMLLTTVQEITNDIISLVLQTMEHGITQTFAARNVLNFEAYRKAKVRPGDVFPVNAPGGKAISEGFHDVKTATLSGEVMPFFQQMQQMGQLTSAALPSLFGGQMEGSGTASEYSMSRAQALQRLGNIWKIFLISWKELFGKAIPAYIKEVKEDEHHVKKNQHGDYINEFIRKAELQGKIGSVEIEANENLPLTWNQRKDVIMQILNAGNPEILKFINTPENLPLIHKAIGLDNFHIHGEADREKQLEEIKQLLESEPITEPMGIDALGQPQEQEVASVDVDPDIDDHEIHFQVCKDWLVSSSGRLAKIENEAGYRNILLHAKMHKAVMMQQMMEQMMMGQPGVTGPESAGETGAAPPAKPNEKSKPTPINGEGDVKTKQ